MTLKSLINLSLALGLVLGCDAYARKHHDEVSTSKSITRKHHSKDDRKQQKKSRKLLKKQKREEQKRKKRLQKQESKIKHALKKQEHQLKNKAKRQKLKLKKTKTKRLRTSSHRSKAPKYAEPKYKDPKYVKPKLTRVARRTHTKEEGSSYEERSTSTTLSRLKENKRTKNIKASEVIKEFDDRMSKASYEDMSHIFRSTVQKLWKSDIPVKEQQEAYDHIMKALPDASVKASEREITYSFRQSRTKKIQPKKAYVKSSRKFHIGKKKRRSRHR